MPLLLPIMMACRLLGAKLTLVYEPNAGLLLIGPAGTNFSEFSIEILAFLFKKMHLEMPSAKRRVKQTGC